MPAQNKRPIFVALVTSIVAAIVVGGVILSALAIKENMRFSRATDQILWMIGAVRSVAGQQANFAQNPGEDIWADLAGAGQIQANASRANPWQNDVRAVTVAPASVRIESDLPTHECRRVALYFLEHQPAELGITSIETQAPDTRWLRAYPLASGNYVRVVDIACGKAPVARLALVFKIK